MGLVATHMENYAARTQRAQQHAPARRIFPAAVSERGRTQRLGSVTALREPQKRSLVSGSHPSSPSQRGVRVRAQERHSGLWSLVSHDLGAAAPALAV